MNQIYKRPVGTHQNAIIVENSRFITSINRASSVEDARAYIAEIEHTMPDASHHVYAFRVGYEKSVIEGMSDDGEPSGTAGPPTLSVLRGTDIGDIVMVTTRYFGGKKLGKGGLVRAYTQAAQIALEDLPTELKVSKVRYTITIGYTFYELVKRLVQKTKQYEIQKEIFTDAVSMTITVFENEASSFEKEILDLTHGQAEIEILGNREA